MEIGPSRDERSIFNYSGYSQMVHRPPSDRRNRTTLPPVSHVLPKRQQRKQVMRKRTRRAVQQSESIYQPPEDWHEPQGDDGYHVVRQEPGSGYRHILTKEQIRDRLAQLPSHLLEPLEVVQLSRMTTKKRAFPCYGMQWGATIYLYPLEAELVEYFSRPPRPAEYIEARQFGGRWVQSGSHWRLEWTRTAIEDFYLNNVLIHELGHLLDTRNTSFRDRERYAEWFALEHGFKPTR